MVFRPQSTNTPNKLRKTVQSERRKTSELGPKRVVAGSGPVILNSMPGDPFPVRMFVTQRYGQLNTLTAGSAGLFGSEQIFRLNSLFDPDLTGTGHQPYGFDTLASIYNRYKVHAVTARLRWSDPSADGVIVAANFQAPGVPTSITGSDPNTIMERLGMWTANLNNTGDQEVVFTQRFTLPDLCGCTKQQFDSNTEDYQSAVSTSPVRTPFLRLAIAALDGSSTPTVRCETLLIFEVEYFERLILPQS